MRTIKLKGKYKLIVDNEDFKSISESSWLIAHRGNLKYAVRWRNYTTEYAHRVIMNAKRGQIVDHINGNGLDNRRSNLRVCSNAENTRNQRLSRHNTSGFKGVSFCKTSNKWKASVSHNSKRLTIGRFSSKKEAALAYNEAAKKLFGAFAKLNLV